MQTAKSGVPIARVAMVIFDLFETLITEQPPQGGDNSATHMRAEVPRHPAEVLGVDLDMYSRVWKSLHRERMTGLLSYRDVLYRIADCAGIHRTPLLSQKVDQLARVRLDQKRGLFRAIDPEVLAVLSSLIERGFRLGVISNCSADEISAWNDCQIRTFFDVAVFSCEVGEMKPDRSIYLRACRQADVSPTSVAYVGDGGSDELAGAAAVGMTTFRAAWYVDRADQRQTAAVRRISEIPPLLAG